MQKASVWKGWTEEKNVNLEKKIASVAKSSECYLVKSYLLIIFFISQASFVNSLFPMTFKMAPPIYHQSIHNSLTTQ